MTTILKTTAEINKRIETVRRSGATFQNGVQISAVSIAAHIAAHRDKTLLIKLYDAMPNGTRRKSMIDWWNHHVGAAAVATYGKTGLDVELAALKSDEWGKFVSEIDETVNTMAASPWHEYKVEKGEQELDLDAIIAYLGRKANAQGIDTALKAKLTAIHKFAESQKSGKQGELKLVA